MPIEVDDRDVAALLKALDATLGNVVTQLAALNVTQNAQVTALAALNASLAALVKESNQPTASDLRIDVQPQ